MRFLGEGGTGNPHKMGFHPLLCLQLKTVGKHPPFCHLEPALAAEKRNTIKIQLTEWKCKYSQNNNVQSWGKKNKYPLLTLQ